MTDVYERRVEVTPGYDLRSAGYGIASCRIWFYVIGPKGAVQWQIGTDWYPPSAREHLLGMGWPSEHDLRHAMQPQAWDIGYHSPTPRYDDQTPMPGKCHLLGSECFYDGSSLNAESWTEGFIAGGTDWLWPKLEEYYRFTFEGGEHPDLTPTPRLAPEKKAREADTDNTHSANGDE